MNAAEANDDGTIDISDPVATLYSLFRGFQIPPPSIQSPGDDPTPDNLDCRRGTHS